MALDFKYIWYLGRCNGQEPDSYFTKRKKWHVKFNNWHWYVFFFRTIFFIVAIFFLKPTINEDFKFDENFTIVWTKYLVKNIKWRQTIMFHTFFILKNHSILLCYGWLPFIQHQMIFSNHKLTMLFFSILWCGQGSNHL